MDTSRKKELKEQAAQQKTYFGVYSLTNTKNSKVFVGASRNLKNQQDRIMAQLALGSHPNKALQDDFKADGKDSFAFKVLEQADSSESKDVAFDLRNLERDWCSTLECYEPDGYNRKKSYE